MKLVYLPIHLDTFDLPAQETLPKNVLILPLILLVIIMKNFIAEIALINILTI